MFVVCLLLCSHQTFAQKTKTKQPDPLASAPVALKVPFTADRWELPKGNVTFLEYKGRLVAKMDEHSGDMFLKDLNFTNGIIEFDVEVDRPFPFPSIYFRWQNKDETELVYLRTGAAIRKNAFDAVQYASIVKGVNLWDVQHEYQSSADIKIGDWNHVKLVVSGKQLKVFINNMETPNLEIPCLEGNTADGKIGIGTGFPGQCIFANLVITPNETEGLSGQPGADITRHDTRYIRNWRVSQPDSLPFGEELSSTNLPKNDSSWTTIIAERRGLVNLSRKFGTHSGRQYVWLKAKIVSQEAHRQVLKMGFSDEIWVFVNQKPVYVDKNIYYEDMRKDPDGRISLDNCSFLIPLAKGENELLIGVANDFYGWGIMARLEHLEGVEIH